MGVTTVHRPAGVVDYPDVMRQMLSKVSADTPDFLYTNVTVELVSDDDVTMTATVSNRQGIVLVVLRGTWLFEAGAWIIDLDTGGQAVLTVMGGCGCGGSSVEAKPSGTVDLMAGVTE
jgi:hypothetical protein